jgi:hypothetical protein
MESSAELPITGGGPESEKSNTVATGQLVYTLPVYINVSAFTVTLFYKMREYIKDIVYKSQLALHWLTIAPTQVIITRPLHTILL